MATPSYKLKKEKREAKRSDSNPADDSSLVDPATVSVIGAVGDASSAQASSALGSAPLQIGTLFPDAVIKRAEEEISHYDSKSQPSVSYARGKNRFHPYERVDKKFKGRSEVRQERPAWKNIGRRQFKRSKGKSANFSSRPAKGQQSYK